MRASDFAAYTIQHYLNPFSNIKNHQSRPVDKKKKKRRAGHNKSVSRQDRYDRFSLVLKIRLDDK